DDMVPLVRYSYAGGIPVERLLPKAELDAIVERTRFGGGEVLQLMGSSAFYAPASSLAEMIAAILHDEHRLLPLIAYLNGEYGYSGLYVGVPAVLGGGGVERVVEVDFTPEEQAAFARSVGSVQKLLALLEES
ncbi:MAG: malate dehydrogenase, partial [Firmicutes bacterium]|nr:malate dehydrogenase [Bacillota bacterium]